MRAPSYWNSWENSGDRINYFNIAGEGSTSVRQIAEMVVREMGTKTKITYQKSDRGWPGDVPIYKFINIKLSELGWFSKLTSDQAVELAIRKILGS